MSGKTTFIRTVGINLLCAQTIHTAFAAQVTLNALLMITSALMLEDNLSEEKSYYFREVECIKEMVDASAGAGRNLFLLDEIFKGTNTQERVAIALAVLSYLARGNNAVKILELFNFPPELISLIHAVPVSR